MTKKKSAKQEGFIIAENLEGVRLNPSLYLGELGDDMAFRIIKEEVDNSYDEAVAGRNSLIEVVIDHDSDFHIVADAAGGIPTDFVKLKGGKKETILTAAFTRTHAGGKFNSDAYKTSSGTHGIGVAAVNAVCDSLRVWSTYNGKLVKQEFSRGEIVGDIDPKRVKSLDPDVAKRLAMPVKKYGTIIAGKIDQTVVSESSRRGKKLPKDYVHAHPPIARIREWLENVALLQPGLLIRLTVIKDKKKKTQEFLNKKGLGWIPKYMCDKSELSVMGKPLVFKSDYISMSVQWSDYADIDKFLSFVNTSPTVDGGWHQVGFTNALATALKPYMPAAKGKKRSLGFSTSDMLIGLVGMFDFRMHGARYTSQVKDKLASRVDKEVSDVLTPVMVEYFKANQRTAKAIIKRAIVMNKGREELAAVVKSMAEVKKTTRGSALPSSIAIADKAKPHEREFYLVEGDSAAGCFVADTPVRLADGTTLTFVEMAERASKGEQFDGISYDVDNKEFVVKRFVEPRLTKYVTELIEVELSDGTVFQCTTDHPWLVGGEYYVEAEDLKEGDELTQLPVS